MTDDETADAALQLLAGVRRCSDCRELVPERDWFRQGMVPFRCADCWWIIHRVKIRLASDRYGR